MYFFQRLFFILLSGFLLPATANVSSHFEAIKSNPSALYAFFKKMPKGGELHYHLAGGAYPQTLLDLAAQNDYCLNPKTQTLSTMTPCHGIKTKTLTAQSKLYPAVMNAWSMSDKASGTKSDHDHFFATFLKFMPLVVDYRPELLADIMRRAADQNELYLEIQLLPDNAHSTGFVPKINDSANPAVQRHSLLANKKFQANIQQSIKESTRILQQAREHLRCNALPQQIACHVTVKFQYYILREQPLTQVFSQALNGFAAAASAKDIVGVNLVQAEDGVISMRDYRRQMAIFKYLHTVYPKVNIALHAGELAPKMASSSDQNTHIQDAIFIGQAQRIGHGVNIKSEKNLKTLIKYMKNRSIPVEINLTSNRKILGVTGKAHPLNYYQQMMRAFSSLT